MSLRLLSGGRDTRPLAPRILLCALEPELIPTLSAWIREAWPGADIRVRSAAEDAADSDIDLRIQCGRQLPSKTAGSGARILWLGELDRARAPLQLGPALWHSPMPTTPAGLRHAIALCLLGPRG